MWTFKSFSEIIYSVYNIQLILMDHNHSNVNLKSKRSLSEKKVNLTKRTEHKMQIFRLSSTQRVREAVFEVTVQNQEFRHNVLF